MSPRPPGHLTLLRNFLRAAARESAAAWRGDPEMPPAEATRRLGICRTNVCGQYLGGAEQCAECGCDLQKKVAWRTASCPLGHWPALTPTEIPPPRDGTT